MSMPGTEGLVLQHFWSLLIRLMKSWDLGGSCLGMFIRSTRGASAIPALLDAKNRGGALLVVKAYARVFHLVKITYLIRLELEAVSGRIISQHFDQAHER